MYEHFDADWLAANGGVERAKQFTRQLSPGELGGLTTAHRAVDCSLDLIGERLVRMRTTLESSWAGAGGEAAVQKFGAVAGDAELALQVAQTIVAALETARSAAQQAQTRMESVQDEVPPYGYTSAGSNPAACNEASTILTEFVAGYSQATSALLALDGLFYPGQSSPNPQPAQEADFGQGHTTVQSFTGTSAAAPDHSMAPGPAYQPGSAPAAQTGGNQVLPVWYGTGPAAADEEPTIDLRRYAPSPHLMVSAPPPTGRPIPMQDLSVFGENGPGAADGVRPIPSVGGDESLIVTQYPEPGPAAGSW